MVRVRVRVRITPTFLLPANPHDLTAVGIFSSKTHQLVADGVYRESPADDPGRAGNHGTRTTFQAELFGHTLADALVSGAESSSDTPTHNTACWMGGV